MALGGGSTKDLDAIFGRGAKVLQSSPLCREHVRPDGPSPQNSQWNTFSAGQKSYIPRPNPRCERYDSHVLATRKLPRESWKLQFRAIDDEIRRTIVSPG